MFTFGRDHERKCAAAKLRKPDQAAMLVSVVDAVHDLLEGKSSLNEIRPILIDAFIAGGSGVWETTGSWMRQIIAEHPDFSTVWCDLASHSDSQVRFRVACFINDMPAPIAKEVGEHLRTDRSKKVREMAIDRLENPGT